MNSPMLETDFSSELRIAGTEYNLKYNALEVYFQGCKDHPCEGCHNPQLWTFEGGKPFTQDVLKDFVDYMNNPLVDRVWLLGGEPTDQPADEMLKLLRFFKTYNKEVWLWTHRGMNDIDVRLFKYLDYVKTGEYKKGLPPYTEKKFGIRLASNNQKIREVRHDLMGE